MIYILSLIIYVIILGIGIYLIRNNPKKAERSATTTALTGFIIQIFINWASLGNIPAMPQIGIFDEGQQGSLDFLILSLISIFCYGALLVILYKANDYYHET